MLNMRQIETNDKYVISYLLHSEWDAKNLNVFLVNVCKVDWLLLSNSRKLFTIKSFLLFNCLKTYDIEEYVSDPIDKWTQSENHFWFCQ